jgi:hypothetical protein
MLSRLSFGVGAGAKVKERGEALMGVGVMIDDSALGFGCVGGRPTCLEEEVEEKEDENAEEDMDEEKETGGGGSMEEVCLMRERVVIAPPPLGVGEKGSSVVVCSGVGGMKDDSAALDARESCLFF